MKPITSKIMAEIDRKAQEDYGISQLVLMENAGRTVAEIIIAENRDTFTGERIAIFCGKGNNGGDGFVVGRYLAGEMPERLTVYVDDVAGIKEGAARDNFETIRKSGLNICLTDAFVRSEETPLDFTICVDAVFGTGFRGDLPEKYAALGKRLNASNSKVYAIDVPSGLNATTGEASGNCLKADRTITFGLPKEGFYVNNGPDVCGEVIVKNIGFPQELLEQYT